jgi:hypothetical protein
MTKFIAFLILLFLVISTSIIKNSTKGTDDKIYTVKENLLFLENRLADTQLEFDYLSSSEKLLEYQKLYFEKSLEKKSLQELKILEISNNETKISDLTILSKNEQ